MPHGPERWLAIETTGPRLSLALGSSAEAVSTFEGSVPWRHAEALFENLEKLLKRLRWPIRSLTGVAVSVGPGSFTGIRVGLAAARTLGQGLGIPVVGVNALEILAYGQPHNGLIGSVMDALRGSIYTALYERTPAGAWREVQEPRLCLRKEWSSRLKSVARGRPVWLAGDGLRGSSASEWKSLKIRKAPEDTWHPSARALLALAAPRLPKAGPSSYKNVLPLYLRQASAEERRIR